MIDLKSNKPLLILNIKPNIWLSPAENFLHDQQSTHATSLGHDITLILGQLGQFSSTACISAISKV